MSHVAAIELQNWGPYRGCHSLELGPGAYSVVARYDSDAERSNWAGKSWLLGAIRFALFGTRPPDARLEDDWVTRGEQEGAVILRLSNGVTVARSRRLGGPTQLRVMRVPGSTDDATGKHAADALAAHLRLTDDDFAAGAWVGQADVARMVLAKPAERAATFEAWLELGPLRQAEKAAAKRASTYSDSAELALARLKEARAEAPASVPTEQDLDAAREAILGAKRSLEQARAAVEREFAARAEALAEHRAAQAGREQAQAAARRRARLTEEISLIRAQLEGAPESHQRRDLAPLRAANDDALVEQRRTRDEVERLRALVRGDGFDGTCPVTCAECPVADQVRADGRKMADQVRAAAVAARVAGERVRDTREGLMRAEALERRLEALLQSLARAELELRELPPGPLKIDAAVDGNGAFEWDEQRLARLRQYEAIQAEQLAGREEALRALERAVSDAAAVAAKVTRVEADAAKAEKQSRTWSEAAAILRGARREVAEGVAGTVEGTACALLAEAGVDLSVRFRWEREGQGLAANCHKCGGPFPPKASATRCGRCGADRGQKVVEALELLPSRRSGAADSLAGLFVQLGAAAWLRERRASPLGIVVVDEPFAALDRANSRALGAHLHRALSGGLAFEQAFVVAHDQAVTEAMPRHIVVRSDGRHARLEVE